MAGCSSLMAYKTMFSVLGCLMVVTLVYTIFTDGSPFRRELLTPWMVATLVDFYVNVVCYFSLPIILYFLIGAWVVYKESTWISAVLWIIFLVCFGSITTCAYIVKKLGEISSHDPVQNLLRQVFLRIGSEGKIKDSSIVFLKILFSMLGLLVFGIVTYTLITDGSPFRMELLTHFPGSLRLSIFPLLCFDESCGSWSPETHPIRCTAVSATPTSENLTPAISLTPKALNHLNKIRAERNEDLCLRIGVKQGGCSGMSYTMDFENRANAKPDDSIIEYNGFQIVCDPKSLLFLYGMQLDFSDALIGGGFSFKNPST
ncbi:hypothetical protein J5N97_000225 [Dioscorea zingiberensis]|uniref:Core domain-containing protein n=1 Tax=Dioscorea zingiberensis TaxID=325984 RepID=A0A9D5H1T3_9LILI|nr:hypothetical protein J5N97_000225 [Dioscorea zingiberensis]